VPIRIEDIVHLEEIKATLARSLEGIKLAFGELTFGFLTVIDAHNKLEAKLDATQAHLDATQAQLDATQARLEGEIATIKRALNLGPSN
jgi:outer membrane protein TolC